ncbi:hypothetical protein L9F63_017523, partial [Diploptera punctata]
ETDSKLGPFERSTLYVNCKGWRKPKSRTVMPSGNGAKTSTPVSSGSGKQSSPLATPSSEPVPPATSSSSSSSGMDAAASAGAVQVPNKTKKEGVSKKKGRNKEVMIHEPAVLIEGVLFRARYLGSTQLVCEGQPTKTTRMTQAEEAVSRIKMCCVSLTRIISLGKQCEKCKSRCLFGCK